MQDVKLMNLYGTIQGIVLDSSEGDRVMKTGWIPLIPLFVLALASCNPPQGLTGAAQPVPEEASQLQETVSQTPAPSSSKSVSSSQQLPAPTVGSVVIMNTAETPMVPFNYRNSITPDAAFQDLTQKAMEDLANRLNIQAAQVEFIKVVSAGWPYDSVGCPLPDAERPGTQTPGFHILLKANDQVYTYHTDGKDWVVFCNIKPPNEIRMLP